MAWYVYKCNSKNKTHQKHCGDWADLFRETSGGKIVSWGTSKVVPELAKLREDDRILAYQTDRNELIGVVQVTRWSKKSGLDYVFMKPLETIGVKVRPLKTDAKVAGIHAFKTREVKTLYDITANDAKYLLKIARRSKDGEFPRTVTGTDSITSVLRQLIADSDMPLAELAAATGVQRASIQRFIRGEQSLRLDAADKLAAYFGICVSRKGSR